MALPRAHVKVKVSPKKNKEKSMGWVLDSGSMLYVPMNLFHSHN